MDGYSHTIIEHEASRESLELLARIASKDANYFDGRRVTSSFTDAENVAFFKLVDDLRTKTLETQELWGNIEGPARQNYNDFMIVRFEDSSSIIKDLARLIFSNMTSGAYLGASAQHERSLDIAGIQHIEGVLAEDERLVQAAQINDHEPFDIAIEVKQTEHAVDDAESTLRQAKEDAALAVKKQLALAKRIRIKSFAERAADMIPEMRDAVLEAAITSRGLRWRPTEAASLASAVDDFFAWPSLLDQNKRDALVQAACPILLTTATIELPAQFTLQSGTTAVLPVIPQALQGNTHYIQYLVLDLRLDYRNDAS